MDINRSEPPDEQARPDRIVANHPLAIGPPAAVSPSVNLPLPGVVSSGAAATTPRSRPLPIPLSRPIVTQILVGINVVVWVALTLYATIHYGGNLPDVALGSSPALDRGLLDFGALANACVAGSNVGPVPYGIRLDFPCIGTGQWWRLFTAMFLHIGVLHLTLNSWALYLFGREAEQLYGRVRFLAIYLLAGLGGSVASMTIMPGLDHVSAGASGAIFGIIGVLLAYYFRYRNQLGAAGRAQLYNMAAVAALNLFLSSQIQNIDNWAHLGGLIGGTVLGLLLAPAYRVVSDSGRVPHLVDNLNRSLQLAVVGGYVLTLGLFFAIGLQRLGS
jgi:membrane associated rhomboid family serine protease